MRLAHWLGVLFSAAAACRPPEDVVLPGDLVIETAAGLTVKDVSIASNWQGGRDWGRFHKGRTNLIADIDGDGWQDAFIGNPAEASYVMWNRSWQADDGKPLFATGPTLTETTIAWGGALVDLDNDGDDELFVTGGGNEFPDLNVLFQNQLAETGTADFVDVTDIAGVGGRVGPSGAKPAPHAQANAADFDRDGLLDLFVSVDITPLSDAATLSEGEDLGQNLLFVARGDGSFDELASDVGLTSTEATQNSVALDFDNDGDLDIYENTVWCDQHIWRNDLVETGALHFTDVTDELSITADLRYPQQGFSSFAADFNEDGWEDILVFVRAFEPAGSPFLDGHVMLINAQGKGFVDVAPLTGINDPYINWEQDTFRNHTGGGVMGSNAGDVNGDGVLDVYVGQGGPTDGTTDIFFLSTGTAEVEVDGLGTVTIPQYEDASELIDFKAWKDAQFDGDYPPYPYRTHAVAFADYNRDGTLEISVQNGGPSDGPDIVREPNRLFQFTLPEPPQWLEVQLVGNGKGVNRSAIGASVTLTAYRTETAETRTYHQWKHAGNGFATSNDELYFGLAGADEILELSVTWPDGAITDIVPAPAPNQLVRIDQASGQLTVVTPHR